MMINKKICVLDIETTSLEPWSGRIVVIGIKGIFDKEVTVFSDEDEEQLLDSFLQYYHNREFTEIIGYNVSFDIRFIFGRCLKYGLYSNGFFKSSITDLMQIMKTGVKFWGSWNRPGKLDEWLQCVFDTGKIELPDKIKNLFEKGRISEIIRYNKWDVEATHMLWKRVQKVFFNAD